MRNLNRLIKNTCEEGQPTQVKQVSLMLLQAHLNTSSLPEKPKGSFLRCQDGICSQRASDGRTRRGPKGKDDGQKIDAIRRGKERSKS